MKKNHVELLITKDLVINKKHFACDILTKKKLYRWVFYIEKVKGSKWVITIRKINEVPVRTDKIMSLASTKNQAVRWINKFIEWPEEKAIGFLLRKGVKELKTIRTHSGKVIEKKFLQQAFFSTQELKTFHIIWDDIVFEKDIIKIKSERIKDFIRPIPFKGSIEELNNIKDEYFGRLFGNVLYKITCKYFEDFRSLLFDKELSQKFWNDLEESIEEGKKYYEFKITNKTSIGPNVSLRNGVLIYNFSNNRTPYLKILADLHFGDFSLIPIKELVGNALEDSFLFRIITKRKNILIVWENVNDRRASHVFFSTPEKHDLVMKDIQSFIKKEHNIKRSILHQKDHHSEIIKKRLGFVMSVSHTETKTFKYQIIQAISKY